jgi:hypothetical protein
MGEQEMEHFINAMKAVSLSAWMSMGEADMIVERILSSTCRTASGADSYFMLDRLFVEGNRQP